MSRTQKRHLASPAQTGAPFEAQARFRDAIGGKAPVEQKVADGIRPQINYVHDQILKCVSSSDDVLTELYGPGTERDRISQLFDALSIVSDLLYDLDVRISLNDIAQHLRERSKPQADTELERVKTGGPARGEHHLAFACLGWLCMLFTPAHELSGDTIRLKTTDFGPPLGRNGVLPQPDIYRPVGTMLRKMGLLPIPCPAVPQSSRNMAGQQPQIMKLSVICYASLRQIGGVSIVWVNNLMEHCDFDSERQELKVFRFPAYCLYAMQAEPGTKILTGVLRAHTCAQSERGCDRLLPAAIQSYLREILLSYRVLFGQDQMSRRLFRARERSNARFKPDDDPILQALCGRKHPPVLTDYLHIESEKMVFDVQADFPHLGEKLLKVHNYNANQKPSLWRSLFLRDPRDTRESFNLFLTVVVVGGLSVTLSLIQTIVAVVTLVKKLD